MDAKHTLGEPRAFVSRAALLHNASLIRKALAPGTRICAIVKADAYGHNASVVVDTLTGYLDDGMTGPAIDALAVASIDEAALLSPVDVPVLILRPIENAFVGRQRARIEFAAREGWVLTVCSAAAATDVARIAMGAGCRANVQVMVDTGMTRSGTAIEDLDKVVQTIHGHASLKLHSLCTHFACSEEADNPFNDVQLMRFCDATNHLADPKKGAPRAILRHAANSGGIFNNPMAHFDMVRPGISLYGIDPLCRPCLDRKLRPVMKWTAPLVMIKDVKAGVTVGYGQTFTMPRDGRIGLVPVGYADGYPRSLSNKGVMMINGRPAPVVGRVSMDLITLDLTDVPHPMVGDEVTVMDNDPLSPASVYKLAEAAGTIPYEILCGIGSRIPRIAIDDFTGTTSDAGRTSTGTPDPDFTV